MGRKFLLIAVLLLCASFLYARHLKGGWIFYEYMGDGALPNTSRYRVTVNQYLSCSSGEGQIDPDVFLGVFYAKNNSLYSVRDVVRTTTEFEEKKEFNKCISDPPYICYRIDKYSTTIDLPDDPGGYILAVQRCCRIEGIVNVSNSGTEGVTYTASIPGVVNGVVVKNNNSPVFQQKDTSVVCVNSAFDFDFSATDRDHDSLVYSFCSGLIGGSNTPQGARPDPPANPPFSRVLYAREYNGESPLGSNVTIDSRTGLISGTAPSAIGDYVVAVCVDEIRNGIKISQTRKELHITVASCELSGAKLKPDYITCDGFNFTFVNESGASNINSYLWSFGFKDSVSREPMPTVNYPDTGVYKIKLVVSNAQGCSDSTVSQLRVYPGFQPNFTVSNGCFQSPYQFKDATSTRYGLVDSWQWNFGDALSNDNNTAADKNPQHKYNSAATYNVQLIVTNSKGCIDTIVKPVESRDKPLITLPFRDTLICSIDELQLGASTDIQAAYSWIPDNNTIRNANTSAPTVFPKDTTIYFVTVDDGKGCVNTDSIRVNVIDHVTLSLAPDTAICLTDTVQLHPVTNALYFSWSPTETLNGSSVKEPLAVPTANTTYKLTASVGKCFADGEEYIKTYPYPQADAGMAIPICYGYTTQLHATYKAETFEWSPTNSLTNSNTLTPVAGPQQTTLYTLRVHNIDPNSCPKPVTDTVLVVVIPPVQTFAGNDTNIVIGQPLQLHATGAVTYSWWPVTNINNTRAADPVVTITGNIDTITYHVRGSTPEGCFDDDSVRVSVYKTLPEIFVPSAFTPNGDGVNDVLRPVAAGIKKLEIFSIYNRWGQLLYTTNTIGEGWNGIYLNSRQPAGTYVFMVKATDYLDKTIAKRGTVVLIR